MQALAFSNAFMPGIQTTQQQQLPVPAQAQSFWAVPLQSLRAACTADQLAGIIAIARQRAQKMRTPDVSQQECSGQHEALAIIRASMSATQPVAEGVEARDDAAPPMLPAWPSQVAPADAPADGQRSPAPLIRRQMVVTPDPNDPASTCHLSQLSLSIPVLHPACSEDDLDTRTYSMQSLGRLELAPEKLLGQAAQPFASSPRDALHAGSDPVQSGHKQTEPHTHADRGQVGNVWPWEDARSSTRERGDEATATSSNQDVRSGKVMARPSSSAQVCTHHLSKLTVQAVLCSCRYSRCILLQTFFGRETAAQLRVHAQYQKQMTARLAGRESACNSALKALAEHVAWSAVHAESVSQSGRWSSMQWTWTAWYRRLRLGLPKHQAPWVRCSITGWGFCPNCLDSHHCFGSRCYFQKRSRLGS